MSQLGHSLRICSAPASSFVRCWSNRRQTFAAQRTQRSANRDRCTAATFYSISGNSTNIHGTHVPMEEPSTASGADVRAYAGLPSCPSLSWRSVPAINPELGSDPHENLLDRRGRRHVEDFI